MLHILQGGQFFVKACIVFIMHSIYFLPVAQKKICCIIVAAADVFVRILQRLLSATFILPDFPRRIFCDPEPHCGSIIILLVQALFRGGISLFAAERLDIGLFLYQLLKNILHRGRSSNCAAASCSRLPARAEREQEYQRQRGAYASFHIQSLLFYCRSFQLVSAFSISANVHASTTPSCV